LSIPHEDISTLTDLGLSISQAKAYLSLAKAKTLTVNEISKASGIARPHVYIVLSELEEAGLILRIIDQPERFQAITIDECVSALMRRRIMRTAELQEKTSTLTRKFRTNHSVETPAKNPEFALIPKHDAVYAKAEKMLKDVQESLYFLCLTRRMFSWLVSYLPALEEAIARSVDCRVIMPKPKTNFDLWKPFIILGNSPNFALRLIPKEPKFGFSVWDKKEVLMTTSPVDSPGPAITLWSNNMSIVDLCQEHFCCLWEKAEVAHFDKAHMVVK
jgi:sugar-specific transcriptional regulator TrmB